MPIATILKFFTLFLTLFHSAWLVKEVLKNQTVMAFNTKIKFFVCGIISFLADTIGIGSFAINIAIAKAYKLLPTDKLPGFVNSVQVLPGTIQAIIFIKLVNVDLLTLVTLSSATAIGGILGAGIISRVNVTFLKKIMILCFSGMVLLLISTESGLMDISGNAIALSGNKLLITSFFMMIAGALSAACVGLYAVVQVILFIAGMSPLVAFPIMMASGALQQPLVAMTFLANKKVPLKETLIVTLSGLIGIAIGLPLITSVSSRFLHCLLMFVLIYNIMTLLKSLKPIRTP